MEIKFFSRIADGRQDGAISNDFLFSFNHRGVCTVYEIKYLGILKEGKAEPFSEFTLDKSEIIVPHSNSVTFGKEYYDEKDEFPLLYTNIYNNYCGQEDKLKGVCLVYRIQREGKEFRSTLVQMIEVGFTEDVTLWKSAGENDDIRPYGNMVVDAENGIFYAFTMRDKTRSTRYFSFKLPTLNQGQMCEKYGVKRVVLDKADILEYFDCEYHKFIQGACCNKGKIYSLEGFTDNEERPPAIRIIDPKLKKEILFKKFSDMGTNIEPEMIDFEDDICYYTDHNGNVYILTE